MNPGTHREFGVPLKSAAQLQEAVASLSRGAYFREASLDMTLSLLTESAVRLAGVDSVSIWALTHDHRELRCLDRYDRLAACRSNGGVIHASAYPVFFQSLREGACVAADDALTHPATAGFAPALSTMALLAAPIHIRGELQGALCLEQRSQAQPWTTDYRLFAHALANLVTLALVEFEAGEARHKAIRADECLRVLFDRSTDAMLLVDALSDEVLDANRQAETLFGCRRQQLTGRSRQQIYQLPATPPDGVPVGIEIRHGDGVPRRVEVLREVAELDGGGRLALEILRPAA